MHLYSNSLYIRIHWVPSYRLCWTSTFVAVLLLLLFRFGFEAGTGTRRIDLVGRLCSWLFSFFSFSFWLRGTTTRRIDYLRLQLSGDLTWIFSFFTFFYDNNDNNISTDNSSMNSNKNQTTTVTETATNWSCMVYGLTPWLYQLEKNSRRISLVRYRDQQTTSRTAAQ